MEVCALWEPFWFEDCDEHSVLSKSVRSSNHCLQWEQLVYLLEVVYNISVVWCVGTWPNAARKNSTALQHTESVIRPDVWRCRPGLLKTKELCCYRNRWDDKKNHRVSQTYRSPSKDKLLIQRETQQHRPAHRVVFLLSEDGYCWWICNCHASVKTVETRAHYCTKQLLSPSMKSLDSKVLLEGVPISVRVTEVEQTSTTKMSEVRSVLEISFVTRHVWTSLILPSHYYDKAANLNNAVQRFS